MTVAETRFLTSVVRYLPAIYQADARNALSARGRAWQLETPTLGWKALPPKTIPAMFTCREAELDARQADADAHMALSRTLFHYQSRAEDRVRLYDRKHDRILLERARYDTASLVKG